MANIIDSSTGTLKESQRFSSKRGGASSRSLGRNASGSADDALVSELGEKIADEISVYVADVLFPARIVGKTGLTVTINKGAGTGIAQGQVWEIFALGEEMIDPDSGENLGAEEISIGRVKITTVRPKFSQGKILDDSGIEKGQIARKIESDVLATK